MPRRQRPTRASCAPAHRSLAPGRGDPGRGAGPRPGRLLVAALLAVVAGCGPSDRDVSLWLAGHTSPGARVLAEGPRASALGQGMSVRAVRSVADLPPAEVLGYDFVLLDSRVYGPNLRRKKHRAPIYRTLARDPAWEPHALHETRAFPRDVKLLLLKRRREEYFDAAPVRASFVRWDGSWCAPFDVHAPVAVFVVRASLRDAAGDPAAGDEPTVTLDGQERRVKATGPGRFESEGLVLERGPHYLKVCDRAEYSSRGQLSSGPPELVQVLPLASLRNNQFLEQKALLGSYFPDRREH